MKLQKVSAAEMMASTANAPNPAVSALRPAHRAHPTQPRPPRHRLVLLHHHHHQSPVAGSRASRACPLPHTQQLAVLCCAVLCCAARGSLRLRTASRRYDQARSCLDQTLHARSARFPPSTVPSLPRWPTPPAPRVSHVSRATPPSVASLPHFLRRTPSLRPRHQRAYARGRLRRHQRGCLK